MINCSTCGDSILHPPWFLYTSLLTKLIFLDFQHHDSKHSGEPPWSHDQIILVNDTICKQISLLQTMQFAYVRKFSLGSARSVILSHISGESKPCTQHNFTTYSSALLAWLPRCFIFHLSDMNYHCNFV